MWQNFTNAIIGLILMAVSVMGFTNLTLSWFMGLAGLIVAIVGFWGASVLVEETPKHA